MAGNGDVAMPWEASGVHDPVPDSPGTAANTEAGMDAILARLSSLEEELKKANDESAHLREVVERMRSGEKKDDGEDEEPETVSRSRDWQTGKVELKELNHMLELPVIP